MKNIEQIIKQSDIYQNSTYKKVDWLIKAIEQHIQKELLEELELALGKESLNMYHSSGFLNKLEWIEHRIAELKKVLK